MLAWMCSLGDLQRVGVESTGSYGAGLLRFMQQAGIAVLEVTTPDRQDVLVDQFHFLANQSETTMQWKVDGKLQTYTHGKPKGNHTAIYDRKAKRIANGKSWQGKEGMRVERRLKAPPIKSLLELPQLPNPFASMQLVSMPDAPPSEQVKVLYVWDLFRRAADLQGFTAALALLPVEKRTLYRKHLDDYKQPRWNPTAIWANWPKMLDELKIAWPAAWA
jgi:hypothetical protein